MADSRHSFVRVSYDGKDITEALTASVLEFSYNDKASKESDEITLKCHDRENNWIGDWYPKKTVEKVIERPSDYLVMAQALQHGVSAAELQKMINASDLTPVQGEALQTITASSRWAQVVEENPQYKGIEGKIQLIKDIKGGNSTTNKVVVDNAVSGTILRATICVENWDFEGDNRELDCGSFEIDSVDFSGPPDIVAIKALSIPISSSIRNSEKTRAWEDTTLQKIAQDIAGDAGLELMYEVESDIQLDRMEQEEKADMAFLLELCVEYGVALKVTDNKIILFEEEAYESKPVVDTFDKKEHGNGGRILSYSFSQDTSGTVCKVISSYKDPKSGKLVQADFEPPEPPVTGQVAYINERPGDLRGDNFRNGEDTSSEASGGTFNTGFNSFNDITADFDSVRADRTDNALRQAKAVARERNKNEWTCTLRIRGNPNMVSSVNIGVTGFGAYNGKYSVFDTQHGLGGKYETVIKARKVLVGY
jgi:phage protein D